MIRSAFLRRNLHDLWRRVALYGSVIGCVLVGFFVLRLVSAGVRQAPHPIELMVAVLGLLGAVLGVVTAVAGYLLMRQSLLAAAESTRQSSAAPTVHSAAQIRGDTAADLVEADVLDIVEVAVPPPSLPKGAQTLLVLSMRREAAQDVIAYLGESYLLQTKYHGKMRASTLAWMNVLQIISFKPVARLSSLVAGIFVSPRL